MRSTNAGDLQQWIGTLERLRQLEPGVVIPGRGAVTDISGLDEKLRRDLSHVFLQVEDAAFE